MSGPFGHNSPILGARAPRPAAKAALYHSMETNMKRILASLAASLALLLLVSCGGGTFDQGSSAAMPTDVTVDAGDTSATVTWTMAPGVDYWIMFAPATSINTSNWTSILGARSVIKAVSPQLIGGLVNGYTYSFIVNGRVGNGAGGPASPSIAIVPRISGADWRAGKALGSSPLYGAAFGAQFLAVGTGGQAYTSLDGKTWTQQNSTVTSDLRAAAWGGNYLAVGAGGTIVFSADALTWVTKSSGTTNRLNGLATNLAGTYVAVGAQGTITTSTDGGLTWATTTSGTTQDLSAVTYGASPGAFIAVGANGTLLTSADGKAWQAMALPTSADLRGISYALVGLTIPTYVALGANGTLLTSSDAVTWTQRTTGTSMGLNAASYTSRLVVVGDAGTILTSDDYGVTWQAQTSNSSANLVAITHNLYGYLAVGSAGANLTGF